MLKSLVVAIFILCHYWFLLLDYTNVLFSLIFYPPLNLLLPNFAFSLLISPHSTLIPPHYLLFQIKILIPHHPPPALSLLPRQLPHHSQIVPIIYPPEH